MIWVLVKKLKVTLARDGIKLAMLVLALALFAFLTLPYIEGWSFWTTFYWLITTITTVGYGDFSPKSFYGQVCTIVIMFVGIGVAAALITNIVHTIVEKRGKKMKGLGDFSSLIEHTVIMGWNKNIPDLIEEMRADKHFASKIVICSSQEISNPMPNEVDFVQGKLSSEDVIKRSGCPTAKNIVVYRKDDHETITTAIAVTHFDDEDPAHIVAYVRDEDNAKHLKRINKNIRVVRSGVTHLLAQEIQDPGIGEAIECLLSNKREQTLYRVPLDEERIYGYARDDFSRRFPGTIIIGAINGECPIINPKERDSVSSLLVIAKERPCL